MQHPFSNYQPFILARKFNNNEEKTQSRETDPKMTQMIELVDKPVKTAIIRDLQLQPSEEIGKSAP